ncbi:ABC transporter permease subunit [Brunnivagina elsteri]|uniref:ABC transporter permease n=1 Tax=Brunnivagina elsteri CCALA 953 TaxID=987040 RepID=A0A2A2TNF1_9CYAN|nr:ABC transporter permease subunit [Calothrix elsteri]PAX59980.1 ABC transporter permease [Calothrix elsteri CCALA 953]
MMGSILEKIGDRNPQFLREVKGRLKIFPIIFVTVLSLLMQFLVYICHVENMSPHAGNGEYIRYLAHWDRVFQSLNPIFIFSLLVCGTYQIISDISKEESRGTLNFIRLSPQSEVSILTGKILGVPILLYLFIAVAIPFHLISGMLSGIPFLNIVAFYLILSACCGFIFSAATLLSVMTQNVAKKSQGIVAWLGSALVLMFLTSSYSFSSTNIPFDHAFAWLLMFNPTSITQYLSQSSRDLERLQFFYIPVGMNLIGIIGIHLANYAFWTYSLWQGIKRLFRNSNATFFSKSYSYLFVILTQITLWGFTLQKGEYYTSGERNYDINSVIQQNIPLFFVFNLILIFALMRILSPTRQSILDWSRYRHLERNHRQGWQSTIYGDLLLGEKTPSQFTIGINLLLITTPFIIWLIIAPLLNTHDKFAILWLTDEVGIFKALLAIGFLISLTMIYATVYQFAAIARVSQPFSLATFAIFTLNVLPPAIFFKLNIDPVKNPIPWLFSTIPWAGFTANAPIICFALLGEIMILVLLNMKLMKQIKLAGSSTTKELLNTSG